MNMLQNFSPQHAATLSGKIENIGNFYIPMSIGGHAHRTLKYTI